jgi:hypothetical protein
VAQFQGIIQAYKWRDWVKLYINFSEGSENYENFDRSSCSPGQNSKVTPQSGGFVDADNVQTGFQTRTRVQGDGKTKNVRVWAGIE